MRIVDIENGMRHVNIEGKIVTMDRCMLVVDDESGRTFVRYSGRTLENQIERGNYEDLRLPSGDLLRNPSIEDAAKRTHISSVGSFPLQIRFQA